MRHLLRLVLAATACLALATSAAADGPVAVAAKTTCKTTYSSTSTFKRAKVVVIRGVSCKRALQVARSYDKSGRAPRGWQCALAHDARTRLFSCGAGFKPRGSLSTAKRAFVSYGTGRKR